MSTRKKSKNKEKEKEKEPKTSRDRDREQSVKKEVSQKTAIGNDEAPTLTAGGERKKERKLIVKFITRVLEKGPGGLRQEFATMKRFNDFSKMKAFKAAQEEGKNRYKDVGCLDNNRVKLKDPWPHEYIHANYVATPTNPKRFICTQAPLAKTCADFWWMCLQDRVETIFMLCNYEEKGAKKCFEYLPSEEKPDAMVFKEKGQKVTVKFESASAVKFKDSSANVVKTVLNIEGPGDRTLKCNHYHWVDWPDRGVPPADAGILELLEKARVSKGPIAVHCSAGIGRTGSVVMIEYVLDQMLAGQTIEDTDKVLQKIREQRNNSVQTDHQYLFVHQVMMNFFDKRGLLDETTKGYHKQFTEKYLETVGQKK